MTEARCFNCLIKLKDQTYSMEEVFGKGIMIFCSDNCGRSFPEAGTEEAIARIEKIKKSYLLEEGE